MKKLTQKGFSLAEILIALAIISVISTLGFSIAKKGIEDAYQGYFFSGYNGMYTALNIAKEDIYTNPTKHIKNDYDSYQKADLFVKHVQKILNLTLEGSDEYIAPNGIKYKITKKNITSPPNLNIDMYVPSVKTDDIDKNYRIVKLVYQNGKLSSNAPSNGYTSAQLKNGYVDIGNRIDLVTFECTKKTGHIVYDCNEDETECNISHIKGEKSHESINSLDPDTCEDYRLVNPKYAITD